MENTKIEAEKKKQIFMVWQREEEHGCSYWNQYPTLEDAVSENGDGTEVWVAEPRRLGSYRRSVEIQRIARKVSKRNRK